jgi:hypothetical protein
MLIGFLPRTDSMRYLQPFSFFNYPAWNLPFWQMQVEKNLLQGEQVKYCSEGFLFGCMIAELLCNLLIIEIHKAMWVIWNCVNGAHALKSCTLKVTQIAAATCAWAACRPCSQVYSHSEFDWWYIELAVTEQMLSRCVFLHRHPRVHERTKKHGIHLGARNSAAQVSQPPTWTKCMHSGIVTSINFRIWRQY